MYFSAPCSDWFSPQKRAEVIHCHLVGKNRCCTMKVQRGGSCCSSLPHCALEKQKPSRWFLQTLQAAHQFSRRSSFSLSPEACIAEGKQPLVWVIDVWDFSSLGPG